MAIMAIIYGFLQKYGDIYRGLFHGGYHLYGHAIIPIPADPTIWYLNM